MSWVGTLRSKAEALLHILQVLVHQSRPPALRPGRQRLDDLHVLLLRMAGSAVALVRRGRSASCATAGRPAEPGLAPRCRSARAMRTWKSPSSWTRPAGSPSLAGGALACATCSRRARIRAGVTACERRRASCPASSMRRTANTWRASSAVGAADEGAARGLQLHQPVLRQLEPAPGAPGCATTRKWSASCCSASLLPGCSRWSTIARVSDSTMALVVDSMATA